MLEGSIGQGTNFYYYPKGGAMVQGFKPWDYARRQLLFFLLLYIVSFSLLGDDDVDLRKTFLSAKVGINT